MRVFLFFLLALTSACGGVGTVNLTLSLANNNTRDILINFNGEQRLFNVANVIVIFESVSLAGSSETNLLSGLTPAVFRLDPSVEILSEEIDADKFDSLQVSLGIADALAAAQAEEANVFGRSFHIEGAIDTDGDGAVETGIVVYAPAAQGLTFLQEIQIKNEATTNINLVLDLTLLLEGVNFGLAENAGTELALTEDNTEDQTPIVSANVSDALQFQ